MPEKRAKKDGLRSFSKAINAPQRFVFGWCTDFSEDDPKLTGSNFERRILSRTKAKCVFVDLFPGQGGRQNVAVNVVALKPPNKWRLDLYGDPHNASLDFKLTKLARNRTRLDITFRESLLDSEAVGFDELWSKYASEIEKDYGSTKFSKFSVLSTSFSERAERQTTEGERRLAAIMFTDMVGYTALGQRNESLSLALAEEQKRIIRPIIERHRGREVKTMGDAFLVELPSALEAVRCAYEIQRAIKEFNVPLTEGGRIHLRVGVHLGDVIESQGDIVGDAVNVASRIEPLADEDGVCLTRQVYDQVRNKLELSFVSLGLKELKNVAEPLEVYRLVMPWEEKRGVQSPSELDRTRVAVLPLANMSRDPNDEYFADGMTEELINALSHVQGLKVIARTSVARYKSNPKPVSEIAQELGVGTVMEGSVRKAGDRVRVTAQLVDATTEEHLWSENYDRKVEDIFAIQSDVAGMVAESLKTKLLEGDRKQLEAGYTGNPLAYDKYLFAKHSKTRDPLAKVRYYEEALNLDPDFALAHAELARYFVYISGDFMTPKEAFSRAKEHIDRALELNDRLPSAWIAKSSFEFQYEWDLQKAETSIRRAIELNPNESVAYSWHAALCLAEKRNEEAIQLGLKAESLNPYPSSAPIIQVLSYAMANRRDDVIRQCARLKELYPDDPNEYNLCALACGLVGMTSEAVKEMDLLRNQISAHRGRGAKGYTAGVAAGFYAINALNFAILGRTEAIRDMIAEAEEVMGTEYVGPSELGTLYLAAGEWEKAVRLLEESAEERDAALFVYSVFYAKMIAQLPRLAEVKSNPKLSALLRRFKIIEP